MTRDLCEKPVFNRIDSGTGYGEVIAVIGGVRRKIHVFFVNQPRSYAAFMKAYPAETTEAFLVSTAS
ncbi:MAG: hypothetical protein ACOC9Q_00110 [bacterium]